jgi:hypothetical protein
MMARPACAMILALLVAGCAARAHVRTEAVFVATAPPQPVVVVPVACQAGHVYVEGRYHWNGAAWVWVEPNCFYKPGYVWVGPTYVVVQGGVRYHAGYWKAAKVHHKAKPVVHHKPAKPHPVVKAKPVKHKGALPTHK